jgi:hypothetical protein
LLIQQNPACGIFLALPAIQNRAEICRPELDIHFVHLYVTWIGPGKTRLRVPDVPVDEASTTAHRVAGMMIGSTFGVTNQTRRTLMKGNVRNTMLAILFSTVLLVCLSPAAHAETCQAHGLLHLVKPMSTVYCQQNGQILWAVTFDPKSRFVIVANTRLNTLWYFPLALNSTRNDTSQVQHRKKTVSAGFTLTTSSAKNGWVPVSLKGD